MVNKMVLDRVEGDVAILIECETSAILKCSKDFLPKDAKEGDVLSVSFEIDSQATQNLKRQAETLLKYLMKDD